jgi:hypothetical protein
MDSGCPHPHMSKFSHRSRNSCQTARRLHKDQRTCRSRGEPQQVRYRTVFSPGSVSQLGTSAIPSLSCIPESIEWWLFFSNPLGYPRQDHAENFSGYFLSHSRCLLRSSSEPCRHAQFGIGSRFCPDALSCRACARQTSPYLLPLGARPQRQLAMVCCPAV